MTALGFFTILEEQHHVHVPTHRGRREESLRRETGRRNRDHGLGHRGSCCQSRPAGDEACAPQP